MKPTRCRCCTAARSVRRVQFHRDADRRPRSPTLLVSAIVCFLLARYLSDPVRHLRAATRSIADGDLRVRVSSLMGTRRDELAMLAFDFDAMAERLRALLESQRQLLRDVSHELRSPLARLQIALGLARRPNANLEQEFDRIEQETQRLDELIGEILSLSRLDDPARALVSWSRSTSRSCSRRWRRMRASKPNRAGSACELDPGSR